MFEETSRRVGSPRMLTGMLKSASGIALGFSAALGSVLVILAAPVPAQAQRYTGMPASVIACRNIDKIQKLFLSQHVKFKDASAEIEARTVDQYIKRMDAAKIYLLESDIAQIKKDMKDIFGQLRDENCSTLDKVQDLFVKRVQERADYAKKALSDKKFKFDNKTEIVLDPDTRQFPKNKAEADQFHAKYLQFQISNYIATGMKQVEAQQHVARNYDRVVDRVKKSAKDKEEIYSGYLDSFGRALDPHSSYFSRESLEDFEIQMSLSLEGIGATLSSQDGFTTIEQLIDGGSAKGSGHLQPQDKIVAVGQVSAKGELGEMENVVEMDLRDVVRKIRGPKGTKVRLQILRKNTNGDPERFMVDLVRDKIKLEDDAASITYIDRDVNGEKKKVAVLNLPSFYADAKRGGRSSASDMKVLLKKAKADGADALVLDLSQNGGGSLDDAVKIAGLFFKVGNVVKQSSRDPSQGEATLDDRDPTVDWDGPMVVLTSRISASASEIVAGTMKDYQRAVIVGGDHTFGKGSVQSVLPLPPGLGAVKVTVGMFFTPGGFSTQWRGVEGDVVLPGPYATDEMGEKHLDYSLPEAKVSPFLSQDAYVTSGVGAWKKVEAPMLAQLKTRSQARVAKNSEFTKITEELKKSKEKGKVIKLSDSLKDTEKKKGEQDKKKEMSKDEKVAEYLKHAEVQEAANVAADLIALQRGITLTDASMSAPVKSVEKSMAEEKKTR
jgi:carboxyl-terminal processing protease